MRAIRTAAGYLVMTPMYHLYEKTKVLPLRQHNNMRLLRYLLGCYRGSHPNYYMLERAYSPRHVRKDLHDL